MEERLRAIYEPFGLPIVSVSRRSAEMNDQVSSNDFLALKISYINDIANCAGWSARTSRTCGRDRLRRPDRGEISGCGHRLRLIVLPEGHEGAGASSEAARVRAADGACGDRGERGSEDGAVPQGPAAADYVPPLNVAVPGLTLKPGTDDLRKAVSLANVPLLLKQGQILPRIILRWWGHYRKVMLLERTARGVSPMRNLRNKRWRERMCASCLRSGARSGRYGRRRTSIQCKRRSCMT